MMRYLIPKQINVIVNYSGYLTAIFHFSVPVNDELFKSALKKRSDLKAECLTKAESGVKELSKVDPIDASLLKLSPLIDVTEFAVTGVVEVGAAALFALADEAFQTHQTRHEQRICLRSSNPFSQG